MKTACWLGLLLCVSVIPDVSGQNDCLTVEGVFNLELVSDPQISHDGKKIVYVRRFADVMTDKRYSNLWIIGLDGTGPRALTTEKHSDHSPRWSPDGTRVAFISNRDGSPLIYVTWMDTGQTTKLTSGPNPPSGIAWSPDGAQISFAAFVPGETPNFARAG
jgi:acylaminoacyl-peptidase